MEAPPFELSSEDQRLVTWKGEPTDPEHDLKGDSSVVYRVWLAFGVPSCTT